MILHSETSQESKTKKIPEILQHLLSILQSSKDSGKTSLKRHFEFVLPIWKYKTTCDKGSLTKELYKEAIERKIVNETDTNNIELKANKPFSPQVTGYNIK